MNLARALYIPAIAAIMAGMWCLHDGQAAEAAMIGMFGTMISLIGLCAAIRAAKMIKL